MGRVLYLMVFVLVFAQGGCHWFFGDPPPECAADVDCLEGTFCAAGTCVTGQRAVIDRGVDAAALDLALPDLAPPDMAPDLAPPDMALDMAPDMAAPFPGGRCFEHTSMAWVTGAADDTHAPRGLCTPWAVVWTQADPAGGVGLRLLRQPGPPADAEPGPAVLPDSPLASDGRFLVFLTPDEAGVPRAQRLDLKEQSLVTLSPTGQPHRHVARAPGLSAHVEGPAGGVVLTFDDDTRLACQRAGLRQWGVALGSGRAAWFEAPERRGPTTLVVTDGEACTPRVLRPLEGTVADSTQLVAAGGGFFWIERSRAGLTEVVGLVPDARGRLRPTRLPGVGTPVEVAGGGGDHLAVVRYLPGRYVLDLVEVSSGAVRWSSDVSARHPVLGGDWMMWAQAAAFVLWELRYVDLATLR